MRLLMKTRDGIFFLACLTLVWDAFKVAVDISTLNVDRQLDRNLAGLDHLFTATTTSRGDLIPRLPTPIPTERKDRFPSMEERVKIYMSDWYVPPCEEFTDGFVY